MTTTTAAFKARREALVQAVNESGLAYITVELGDLNVRGKSFDFAFNKDQATLEINSKYSEVQVLNKLLAKTNYKVVAAATTVDALIIAKAIIAKAA